MTERKKLWKQIPEVYMDCYDFQGSLNEVITYLQKLKDKYPDAIIDWEYGYSDHLKPALKLEVLETEDEYNTRIEHEERLEQVQREQAIKTLHELKKKYGI